MCLFWKAVVGFGLTCAFASSSAGTLLEGKLAGMVQQFTNNGETSGCGVGISAVELPTGNPSGQLLIFNGSFSIQGPLGGIVKGRASEMPAKIAASGKATLKDVQSRETANIWMKAPGVPATSPIKNGEVEKSEDAGYLVYVSDFESVMGLVKAVMARQSIQVGMRIKGQNYDRGLFGVVKLSDAEANQFEQCIGEWAASITKNLKQADEAASSPN